ncbi:MAG: cation transporter [Flavobacteriales bacterium]
MNTTIKIEGMTCRHCMARVSELLGQFVEAGTFKVNLDQGNVEIFKADHATVEKIKTAINEDGIYKAL